MDFHSLSEMISLFKSQGGKKVERFDLEEHLLEDRDEETDRRYVTKEHGWRMSRTGRYLQLFILCESLALLFLLYLQFRGPTDRECTKRVSSYTPAFEAIEYLDMDFQNAFAQRSEYRGPPTKERETLWLELWHHESIMIEPWAMPLLNRTNLDLYEKVRPEKGDGYLALVEVHHQLHCLNLIRQYTWFLMGKYPEEMIPSDLRSTPKGNRMHVDHCIEALRLALMCQGDMTPLLIMIDPNDPLRSKGDFNTHHRCRNFDKLQKWVKDHGVEDWEKNGIPDDHIDVHHE